MNPVRKVSESESRLQRERDAALSNLEEQKRKLTDLYTKIGQLWEENHTLKADIKTSSNKDKTTEELCETCKAKDTKIAQLQQQLDSAAGVRPKTDPDAAQAGLHIAFFESEEELRIKDLEHTAQMVKIKEEHDSRITRLQDEVRDAHKSTKKERTEKLCTQEQLSNITKELFGTKKQLFDSEEQYRKFYDIIPKPGGVRMAKPPLPTMPRSNHIAEAVDYLPLAPHASRLEPTDHSHRDHSQDKEASPTPSHISDGSEFGRDEHTLEESEVRPTFTGNKRPHELDQDQPSTQRPKRRRTKSVFAVKNRPFSSAENIPWLFCVEGEGGDGVSYRTLNELPPDAQEILKEEFQYWFSASNDVQYNKADTAHHNSYATMVREGNRLANVGRGCVRTTVYAKGKVSKDARETGEHEACSTCQNKGCPCAKMILYDGNSVLCWYRQGLGVSTGTTWQDASYWVRKRSGTIVNSGLREESNPYSSG